MRSWALPKWSNCGGAEGKISLLFVKSHTNRQLMVQLYYSCKINARSSQAKVSCSVTTARQRHRLAFMLGMKHNRQFLN